MIRILVWCLLAHPHIPPAISLDIEILEGEVTYVISGRRDVLAPWFRSEASIEELMREENNAAALRAVTELFAKRNPVTIDGTRTVPFGVKLEKSTGPEAEDYGYMKVTLAYTCEGWPRQVRFLWETFEGAMWEDKKEVPVLIDVGGEMDTFLFSAGEPEHIWHATRKPVRRDRSVAPVVLPEEPPPGIPYLALAALLGGYVLVGWLCRRKRLLLAGATAAAGLGVFALVPRAGPDVTLRPAPEQARTIFESLHQNIYDAFAANTEDGIYDLLRVSVDDSLLDGLYTDIYESLILRNQGGAVARVQRLEVLDRHVDVPEEAARFDVDWKWRVHCAVTHWGHTHERINEYTARYLVRHDGASWKIAQMDVLDQLRIEDEPEED